MNGTISAVRRHSTAAAHGIEPMDKLLAVNGKVPADIVELSYLLAEESIELVVEDSAGVKRNIVIKKALDEDLGLEFETAVFDGVRQCHNNCVFCFVEQMLPNMRKSLYERDDDYRLSFLYGNFLTLTNLQDEDYERIIKSHLSPLYVSVHATDPAIRQAMMNNRKAGEILKNIHRLIENGIRIHTQIVLCPGYNDGPVLEKTFDDLFALYPNIETMAVVPVGLTKNRAHLPKLRLFSSDEAKEVVKQVEMLQTTCRVKTGRSFIYLGDEFYLNAGLPLPPTEQYDGFPQLENGIGLSRNFLDEWAKTTLDSTYRFKGKSILLPVGEAAFKLIDPLVAAFNAEYGTCHKVVPVINHFFGNTINVTGLLTGRDILHALSAFNGYERVILPGITLNKDYLFLDDMSFGKFKEAYKGIVEVAADAASLKLLLAN